MCAIGVDASGVVSQHAQFMVFFLQAEDGIRDLVRSRGLGDVYKRQALSVTVQVTVVTPIGKTAGASFVTEATPQLSLDLSLIHI